MPVEMKKTALAVSNRKCQIESIWHLYVQFDTGLPVATRSLHYSANSTQNHESKAKDDSSGFHNFSPRKVGKVGTARISFISSGKELAC